MTGVIDNNGVQWERCNNCGAWENIHRLVTEQPSQKYEYGRDLCSLCGVIYLALGAVGPPSGDELKRNLGK